MKYNFDEIVNRKNTDSIKWDAPKMLIEWGLTDRFDEDTIPLFTADMDIAVAPAIVDAMHKTADRRIYGYSTVPKRYYDSVIKWFKRNIFSDFHIILFIFHIQHKFIRQIIASSQKLIENDSSYIRITTTFFVFLF